MQRTIGLVVGLAIVAGVIGCATPPVVTRVQSDPPGARIEVNANTVGTAPVDITLPQKGKHHKLNGRVLIRAVPTQPGQHVQEKVLFYRQLVPENVLFDMNREPSVSK
jgi:hypothetical protein